MQATKLNIPDVVMFEPKVFGDDRGFFFESFNKSVFEEATGLRRDFVQDNHSRSLRNVLRGLHYQIRQPQGKLVRVIAGEVFDVSVDIRKSSPTFGKWVGKTLSAENKRILWIPEGFAHGFLVLHVKFVLVGHFLRQFLQYVYAEVPGQVRLLVFSLVPYVLIQSHQARVLRLYSISHLHRLVLFGTLLDGMAQ